MLTGLRSKTEINAWQRGFTILELMIVLAILGIVAAMSTPTFSRMIDNNKMAKFSSDLSWSLVYARSEAIKRNRDVDVLAIGSGWKDGWQLRSGVDIIQTFDGIDAINLSGPSTIRFGANGRPTLIGAKYFVLEAEGSKAPMRCIFINQSGMTTAMVDRNGDGNCANG